MVGNEAGYLGHEDGGQTRNRILVKDISPTKREWPKMANDESSAEVLPK